MMAEEKTASAKLVDNVILTLLARGAILLATSVILPAALWIGSRGISTVDEISKKIDSMKESSIEQAGELKALRTLSNAQGQILADHEARVRVLESTARTIAK